MNCHYRIVIGIESTAMWAYGHQCVRRRSSPVLCCMTCFVIVKFIHISMAACSKACQYDRCLSEAVPLAAGVNLASRKLGANGPCALRSGYHIFGTLARVLCRPPKPSGSRRRAPHRAPRRPTPSTSLLRGPPARPPPPARTREQCKLQYLTTSPCSGACMSLYAWIGKAGDHTRRWRALLCLVAHSGHLSVSETPSNGLQ